MLSLLTALVLALPQAAEGHAKAPAPELKVGDPAPPLAIAEWLKGSPVTAFEPGRVYLVEFWATWCGPCIRSMPHLTELQRQHEKHATFVSVTSEDPHNSLEGAKAMVAAKGEVMGYTVAWDDGQKTNHAYMRAAGRNSIPSCFLVDGTGKIAYIGHPMWLDEVLPDVIAGKWDPKAGNERLAAAQDALELIQSASDAAAGLQAAAKFEADYPRLRHLAQDATFELHLLAGNYAEAYKLGSELVDRAIRALDASRLNGLAWRIVDPTADLAERDLDLALRAAEKSVELTKEQDAAALDTLARVYFLRGDRDRALTLQRKAVEVAPERQKRSMRETLAEYEKAAAG